MFEKICLRSHPLKGLINATNLEDGTLVCFNVPDDEYLLSNDDWNNHKTLPLNKLIKPRISNFESGDAFFAVKLNESDKENNYLLVVFQITVGETHSVKVNGLREILAAFPADYNFTTKALVFVTPNFGKLNKIQKLTTQKGAPYETTLSTGFKQHVFQYKI